jgi:hypothetical protein
MDRGGDAACDMVVYTVRWSVKWITDHDAAECLFAQFTTLIVWLFGEDSAPEDAELRRVGRIGREVESGTPPERPTARMNERLRRYTTVRTALDHMELRTYMLSVMADALSQNVRHGRSALPSMWWAYGAENCTPTPKRPHIWRVTSASKTVSESNFRT